MARPPKREVAPLPSDQPSQPRGTPAESFMLTRQEYSGPIPPPAMMAEFNRVIPDGADRILRMAEKQQEHRHQLEQTALSSDSRQSQAGLLAGTLVATVAYATSGVLGYTGHDNAAIAIAATITAGLVGVFVYGTNTRRKERQEKAELLKSAGERKPNRR